MRYIFAQHDRNFQLNLIKETVAQHRAEGSAHPENFRMHSVYDDILKQLCDHFLGHWEGDIALLGLGGYGRTEMSPFSDIDLLFLRPEDAAEGIYRGIRSILYLLWDSRIELGHSVRTIDECKTEANQDLAVLTSLMDARFIWGSENIFRGLLIERQRMLNETDPLDIYLRIETEIRKSYDKFGHTIYLLEPHLKEGPGSLRYIQLINWLSKMIFGAGGFDDLPLLGVCGRPAVDEIKQGLNFLAEVRARLHFFASRRDDRLKFEAQVGLAEQMGFRDTSQHHGVEYFMREFYKHAATIDFFGRRVLAKTRLFLQPKISFESKILKLDDAFHIGAGGIYHSNPEEFGKEPKEIISGFKQIALTGCEFDIRLVDFIRNRLRTFSDDMIENPESNALFLQIFTTRRASVARALNSAMKVGFLEWFIPAFAWVRFLPQHDVYHQYTVDLHTIHVVDNIDSFARATGDPADRLLRTIFARLKHPEILYLAGLFHDIAKGRGPGHEVNGEQIARPMLTRFGLSPDAIDDVCFLIRNHLAMTHLAFKKDLHDEALVGRFAETVMHRYRLDLLMLLTHADLQAVGPTAFNSWRRMLLEELYYRTLDIIEGESVEGEDLGDWIDEIKSVVVELLPPELRSPELKEFLDSARSRYFLDFYPGIIAEHYTDIVNYLKSNGAARLELGDLIAKKADNRLTGYSAITLITKDRRGLFYRIAGTLSANRINILSAWSHSIGEIAVGTFHVNDIPEGPVDDPARWEHFCSDFKKVLNEEIDVHELVAARRSSKPAGGSFRPRFPVKVEVDNAASDRATIIEVYAHDRPGLLYDITCKLSAFGLNIVLTKITTEIDQAADIFYVQDEAGSKIVDFDRMDEIKEMLHEHLAKMEAEHFSQSKDGVYVF